MDISAINGAPGGGYVAPQPRFEAATNQRPGAFRPDTDYAVPTPGQRVDGVVSSAAPMKEVAMNIDLLAESLVSPRYVIDLLA